VTIPGDPSVQKVNTGTDVRVKLYSETSGGTTRTWWMRPCTVVHVYDGGYTETLQGTVLEA
jgi:hypothetical protein